jgi:hypothetical protein
MGIIVTNRVTGPADCAMPRLVSRRVAEWEICRVVGRGGGWTANGVV